MPACLEARVPSLRASAWRVVERVGRAEEQVLRDVREVAAVLQPRSGRRDVVGRALARPPSAARAARGVVTVPRRERREQLEPLGSGRDRDRDRSRVGRGRDETGRAADRSRAPAGRRRSAGRTRRRSAPSSRPVSAMPTTVSGEPMNANVSALPSLRAGKLRLNDVTIVFGPSGHVVALPLADARSARVGEHGRADRFEVGEQAVALDGRRAPARSRA